MAAQETVTTYIPSAENRDGCAEKTNGKLQLDEATRVREQLAIQLEALRGSLSHGLHHVGR